MRGYTPVVCPRMDVEKHKARNVKERGVDI